jgi:predicted small lipoprotein YifL
MTIKYLKTLALLSGLLALTACSTVAPIYQPDFASVNTLKNNELANMGVGSVTLANPSLDKVTIRGGTMKSPYGSSYAGYYKFAIEEQLKQAGLWDKDANTVVACVVERNDLDGSGSSKGTADLAAKFVVTRNGKEIYNKTHSIHHEWPSSFVGAIAIPNAMQGYQSAVQKLLDAFFSDPALLQAVHNQ